MVAVAAFIAWRHEVSLARDLVSSSSREPSISVLSFEEARSLLQKNDNEKISLIYPCSECSFFSPAAHLGNPIFMRLRKVFNGRQHVPHKERLP